MKYFDAHLHIPTPNREGLDRLLKHLDAETDFVGGNLIVNTSAEMDVIYDHLNELPSMLNIIPFFPREEKLPIEFLRSGWFKIHPDLRRIDKHLVALWCDAVKNRQPRPNGIVVHCYPWGINLEYNVSLPLVLSLACAMPELPILVAHGGGYESWAFRAHTASLPNVYYDFSVTMRYFQGTDFLIPFVEYLKGRRHRLVFGSDWPSADCEEQIRECTLLAQRAGIGSSELESLFLENSERLWPTCTVKKLI